MRTTNLPFPRRIALCALFATSAATAQLAPRQTAYLPAELWTHARLLPGDFDADGDIDVVSLGHKTAVLPGRGFPLYYENRGDAVFTRLGARTPQVEGVMPHGCVGDVDGDGDLDIVVASRPMLLWLNDGKGTFRDASQLLDPTLLLASGQIAELMDCDLDGDLDLISVGQGRSALSLNDGKGRFTHARDLPTHGRPPIVNFLTVEQGDVDGDKKRDLVFAGRGEVVILLGDDKGNFVLHPKATHGLPAIAGAVHTLQLGDIDKDGDLDLGLSIRGNPIYAQVGSYVFQNDGKGGFTDISSKIFTQQASTGSIGLVDFDRDSDLDVVRFTSEGADLFEQVSPTWFRPLPASAPSDGQDAYSAIHEDLDGDGYRDALAIVADLSYGQHLKLWLNDGGRGFLHATKIDTPRLVGFSLSSTLRDLDGDGRPELLNAGSEMVMWNDGHGQLSDGSSQIGNLGAWVGFDGVAAGDLDADGDVDAIFTDYVNFGVHVLMNDGSRKLRFDHGASPPFNGSASEIAIGDVDGDKNADIVAAIYGQIGEARNALLLGDGKGGFRYASKNFPLRPAQAVSVELADFDGDGDLDAFFAHRDQVDRLYFNDGKGSFLQSRAAPAYAGESRGSCHLDFDRDGDPDLVIGTSQALVFLINDGTGTFTVSTRMPPVPGDFRDVECGHFSRDLFPDIVTVQRGYPGELRVFIGYGPGFFRDAGSGFVTGAHDVTDAIATGDMDGDGDDDLYAGRIYRNNERQLEPRTLARQGHALEMRSYLTGAGASLPLFSTVLSVQPIPLGEFGTLELEHTTLWFGVPVAVPATGQVDWSLPIPKAPALYGLDLHVQAMLVPTKLFGWSLSNRVTRRITN